MMSSQRIAVLGVTLFGVSTFFSFHGGSSRFLSPRMMGTWDSSETATRHNNKPDVSFQLAYDQSHGFFDDISNEDWKRFQLIARERVRSLQKVYKQLKGLHDKDVAFYDYFEPDFSCPFERRMGIPEVGDGPKWVCDPHRLARIDSCLVYSIGSHGEFSFEMSIHNMIGNGTCEIHTFDPDPIYAKDAPPYVSYHAWGLVASSEASEHPNEKGGEIFKSIQETVRELGHEGRTIDLFKIDCEGCEWTSYRDWINSDMFQIRQILVELHTEPAVSSGITGYTFFEDMIDSGYVVFHKEPNIDALLLTRKPYYEYAFLKLDPSFRGPSSISEEGTMLAS